MLYLFLSLINLTPEIVTDGIGRNILLVILFGIMCTGIPYIVYYRLLQEIGPVKALTVTYLMPVFGLIWSLMYGEKFVFISLVGLIVILIGIYVLSLHKENEKSA